MLLVVRAADVSENAQEVRFADLVTALSLATDLGMGQPLGWGLRACLLATHVAEMLTLTPREREDTYYLALLHYIGCTTDAHLFAELFGDDRRMMQRFALAHLGDLHHPAIPSLRPSQTPVPPEVFRVSSQARCEVAVHLARWCNFGASIERGLWQLFERWDGSGLPYGLKHGEIMLPVRIVQLAQDAESFCRIGGVEEVKKRLEERAGRGYDPALSQLFHAHAETLFERLEVSSLRQAVLRAEPGGPKRTSREQCERVLEAMADFVDMTSPYLAGHSRGVARLASYAAQEAGLSAEPVTRVRRAGLVRDLGRTCAPAAVWDKPTLFNDGDWELIRLHPYYTERLLAHCRDLAEVTQLASTHHERLDGSGYYRGLPANLQPFELRLLAAADVYSALTKDRAHRRALSREEAVRAMGAEVASGRLDAEAVDYVLKAAGHAVRQHSRDYAGGLSPREVEVLRLVAKGYTNRETAESLGISAKTVGHHVQHIYDKLGVSTRAAATLFAMQHHLIYEL